MKDNSCDVGYAQSVIVSQEFFYFKNPPVGRVCSEVFYHVSSVGMIAKLFVIFSDADAGNDRHFLDAAFSHNFFRFGH